jgi:cupin fold WbuC family metalloprotein
VTKHAILDLPLLDAVSGEAQSSPRLRKNRNLHAGDAAVCNRLLNAIEPGSYVAPHRHLHGEKDETIVVVRGRLGVVIFDGKGAVAASAVLGAGGPRFGVDVSRGTYHTFVALEPGTVFFEAKAGPYAPLADDERAPWAPAEGDPGVREYLAGLEDVLARAERGA